MQGGPKSKPLSRIIIKSYITTASAVTFLINFDYKMSITIL